MCRDATHVVGHEMLVRRRIQPLSNKVADVSNANEDEVADVGREQDVIWGLLFLDGLDGSTSRVLG
jgi:hypothetical protein